MTSDNTELDKNCENLPESFDDMNLREPLVKGIFGYGFQEPLAIQMRCIVPVLNGCDLIAQSQPGTGKTAAFSIALLQILDFSSNNILALVLAPTRLLAKHIQEVISSIGYHMNAKVYTCVGGNRIRDDVSYFEEGQHIIVGTPGRVLYMIKRKALSTTRIQILVMDEADIMLSKSFRSQIFNITQCLPNNVQFMLFSSTMPEQLLEFANRFMRSPVQILTKQEDAFEGIQQFLVDVEKKELKFKALVDLYSIIDNAQSIIFCNTRKRVEELNQLLLENEFKVLCTHGGMLLEKRDMNVQAFRSGSSRMLITTDGLPSYIKVSQISLVINYDIPKNREDYMHRVVRSRRSGRKGVVVNFVTPNDAQMLKDLEEFYCTKIVPFPKNISSLL